MSRSAWRRAGLLTLALGLIVAMLAPVRAQAPEPSGGFPPYDKTRELWFSGTVVTVIPEAHWRSSRTNEPPSTIELMRMVGMHLLLETSTGWYDVHVGPSSYLEARQFRIREGDQAGILGAYMEVDGHFLIVAREITMGGRLLMLRDANGAPLWLTRRRMTE